MPELLFPIDRLDPAQPVADRQAIEALNPHRHELSLLEAILHFDTESGEIAGLYPVETDAFWVRGHIPGRPVLPGVLMLEAGAQLCSYYFEQEMGSEDGFFAFGGVQKARFRRPVEPPGQLFILGRKQLMNYRAARFEVQAVWQGQVAMHTVLSGIVMPPASG